MEKEILEYLYNNFDLGDTWDEYLKDLVTSKEFQGKTKKNVRFFLNKMESDGFLKTREFAGDLIINATLRGFLHYEENYLPKNMIFTDLLIKFLRFVQEIDEDKIKLYPGKGNQIGTFPLLEFYKLHNIDTSYEKKMLFIRLESQKNYVRDSIGYAKSGLTFFGEDNPFLTYEGSLFVDKHKSPYTAKFITNQKMILKENKELYTLIENKLWKDACVKMGSILEYILTKWIESKKIPLSSLTNRKYIKKMKDLFFEEKINYYLKSGAKKYNFEIGSITEWNIVKNVIKDYRNYIHLQKYEERIKKNDYLSERDFQSVYSIFKSLRDLF